MSTPENVPEPWNSFFHELDANLTEEVCLCCVGGFSVTVQYGLTRQTADVDVLSILPNDQRERVLAIAGEGSTLHAKHGIYVGDKCKIATLPENHEERTNELFTAHYKKLRLLGLDPYDLALSKLERNSQRDRDDVKHLFPNTSSGLQSVGGKVQDRTAAIPFECREARSDARAVAEDA